MALVRSTDTRVACHKQMTYEAKLKLLQRELVSAPFGVRTFATRILYIA